MRRTFFGTSSTHPVRSFATRVGHDAVWLAIAGLFCVVEGAVKLTELRPGRMLTRGRRGAHEGIPARRVLHYP